MQKMTAVDMEHLQEAQAGEYGSSFLFQIILNWIDKSFPGAAALLEQAAAVLPWSKVWQAIQTALTEYSQGKDFLTILQDVLAQWVTTADGKMTAKPA